MSQLGIPKCFEFCLEGPQPEHASPKKSRVYGLALSRMILKLPHDMIKSRKQFQGMLQNTLIIKPTRGMEKYQNGLSNAQCRMEQNRHLSMSKEIVLQEVNKNDRDPPGISLNSSYFGALRKKIYDTGAADISQLIKDQAAKLPGYPTQHLRLQGTVQSSVQIGNRTQHESQHEFQHESQQESQLPSISQAKASRAYFWMPQRVKPNPEKSADQRMPAISEKRERPFLSKQPEDLKGLTAGSYVVMDAESQKIMVAEKPYWSLEIASLTKIMTFYVVCRLSEKLGVKIETETVTISETAGDIGGTSAELLCGQVYTVEQLLYGLMLPSGNDAAVALAEFYGALLPHKNPSFVREMNLQSKRLGLTETSFANPHGLPSDQAKSTAYDIAKLCSVCLKDSLFKKIVSTKFYRCCIGTGKTQRTILWYNTNKLLKRQNFIGLKTGITVTAGPCLASAYVFRDKTFISVVLRTTKISRRFKETRKILQWTLRKIYSDLTEVEEQTVAKLGKNEGENSEEEDEFKYDSKDPYELKKRSHILANEL